MGPRAVGKCFRILVEPRTMWRCFRILVGPRTNGGDCLNWKCWWLLYPSWPPGVLGRVVDLGHGVSHGRWWGPVWVLEELIYFKSLWWVPRPVVKPSKGLEELPYKESLVDSTASCETQYSFGRTSFFQESLVGSMASCESQHRFGRTSPFQESLEELHV